MLRQLAHLLCSNASGQSQATFAVTSAHVSATVAPPISTWGQALQSAVLLSTLSTSSRASRNAKSPSTASSATAAPAASTSATSRTKRALESQPAAPTSSEGTTQVPSAGGKIPAAGTDTASLTSQPKERLDATSVILQAVENCKPLMKVRSNKRGAKMLIVPTVVHPREQRSLAIRWIIQAAKKRHEDTRVTLAESLALELLLAYQRKGGARQKRDDLHKVALENRGNVTRS